jgi:hypothetical protein
MCIKDGRIIQGDSFTTCVYLDHFILCLTELQREMSVLGTCSKYVIILILLFNSFVFLEF